MPMSRRDYRLIAETIRSLHNDLFRSAPEDFHYIVATFSQALRQNNASFDAATFIAHCQPK